MLAKLKALREEREEGFTLIELLVVILIIGILASIAIPVFLNQRQTANDGAVESDIKNVSTQIESWIVAQKGAKNNITAASFSDAKKSTGVNIAVKGDSNAYCIIAGHDNGKQYKATDANITTTATTGNVTVATYENAAGGLNKGGGVGTPLSGACAAAGTWIKVA